MPSRKQIWRLLLEPRRIKQHGANDVRVQGEVYLVCKELPPVILFISLFIKNRGHCRPFDMTINHKSHGCNDEKPFLRLHRECKCTFLCANRYSPNNFKSHSLSKTRIRDNFGRKWRKQVPWKSGPTMQLLCVQSPNFRRLPLNEISNPRRCVPAWSILQVSLLTVLNY